MAPLQRAGLAWRHHRGGMWRYSADGRVVSVHVGDLLTRTNLLTRTPMEWIVQRDPAIATEALKSAPR
jgi:hypothetical protein